MKKLITASVSIIFIFVLAFSFNVAEAQETTTTEIKNVKTITQSEVENIVLREINQLRNDYLNKLNLGVTVIVGIFTIITVIIGFLSWRLRDQAEKQLNDIKEIRKQAEKTYLKSKKELDEAKNEWVLTNKDLQGQSDMFDKKLKGFIKKIKELNKQKEILEKRAGEVSKKSKLSGAQKKKINELTDKMEKLYNKYLENLPDQATPMIGSLNTHTAYLPQESDGVIKIDPNLYSKRIVNPGISSGGSMSVNRFSGLEDMVTIDPDYLASTSGHKLCNTCFTGSIDKDGKCSNPSCPTLKSNKKK